jgi:hypothetical protein
MSLFLAIANIDRRRDRITQQSRSFVHVLVGVPLEETNAATRATSRQISSAINRTREDL